VRVLTRDAHAGVPQHEVEEPRLALGEPEFCDGSDTFVSCQSHSSSASPPLRPPPLPPPLRPLIRALKPL
jgi:hypothetical protein